MARVGGSGVQFAGTENPAIRRESSLIDVAGRRKEVLVAKSVVEEVRKRVLQLSGGEAKVERDKEKEKEEKMEKARAAAWAWYQHGKGGKESISSSSGPAGSASTLSVRGAMRSGDPRPKSSRFKTEALRTTTSFSIPGRVPSGRSWDFSTLTSTRTSSSLFDSYEIDSVSKRIDTVFHGEGSSSSVRKPTIGLPPPMRPPGAYVPGSAPKVTTPSPKVTRSSSLRMQFPQSICRSISDVVTREEMALGVDIGKCDCYKTRVARTGGSSWSVRRLSRAIQEIMHVPECEYHPQQQHHERRSARLHLHQHHHQHDHEYHHHVHYQIKLRDGVHHGNSFTTYPGKSDLFVEVSKEKDHLLFPRRMSPKMSPKVSSKLF